MNLISVITSFMMVFVVMTMAAPLEKRHRYSGDGTWYEVSLGSCGKYNNNNEMVAALNAPQMKNGPNPNNNNICDRRIKVTGPKGSVTVRIVSIPLPFVFDFIF